LVLTTDEISQLTTWSRRPTTAQALAQRAKIILASATGTASVEVAAAMGVDRNAGEAGRTSETGARTCVRRRSM
jgi:hypothetical protein